MKLLGKKDKNNVKKCEKKFLGPTNGACSSLVPILGNGVVLTTM